MIRYDLICDKGHRFDSWFANSAAFDSLRAGRQVTCPDCGSAAVEKALMAPAVPAPATPAGDALRHRRDPREEALSRLREHVEKNSDYVGLSFAAEARAMHDGTKPHRSIHGEAKMEEAKKLIEDGVPIAPLPFLPRQKSN